MILIVYSINILIMNGFVLNVKIYIIQMNNNVLLYEQKLKIVFIIQDYLNVNNVNQDILYHLQVLNVNKYYNLKIIVFNMNIDKHVHYVYEDII